VTEADVVKALMARMNTVNTVMIKTKRINTTKVLEPSLDEYIAFKSNTSFVIICLNCKIKSILKNQVNRS